MKDLISKEVFRPLATIVIPGAIALLPFALLVVGRYKARMEFADGGAVVTAFVVLSIAIGLVLEDLGARIELCWFERHGSETCPDHDQVWNRYLASATANGVVGHQYIDGLQMRMKFELSTAPAVVLSIAGWIWFNVAWAFCSWCELLIVASLAIGVAVYLLWESYESTVLLCQTRQRLLEAAAPSANA